tara:strand:+ start:935 stop:1090 length:156 start_codon:yes stop_codon:yes gene_type:complete
MTSKRKAVNIRLSDYDTDRIKKIADKNHRSLTNQVTVWLRERLDDEERKGN